MVPFKNMKSMICSPDDDTDLFDILRGILQEDAIMVYIFKICLDYDLCTLIYLIKEMAWH